MVGGDDGCGGGYRLHTDIRNTSLHSLNGMSHEVGGGDERVDDDAVKEMLNISFGFASTMCHLPYSFKRLWCYSMLVAMEVLRRSLV